jgi:uncharacterized protein
MRLTVRLTPRGGRDQIEGAGADGELRVRVRAAPVEGAANEALCRLLARELHVPRSGVALERGASARTKRIRIDGVAAAAARERWPGVAADDG